MIMAMVAMIMMASSVSAQKIDGVYLVARALTDKMVEELGLSNVQRDKTYQANLYYLNGINSRGDINSRIWKQRNSELKGILTSSQWKRYKNASGFYRPISWRDNSYVHNFSDNRHSMKPSRDGNRGNMAVTLPAPSHGQRPVVTGRPQQAMKTTYGKDNDRPNVKKENSGNRTFGSMRR